MSLIPERFPVTNATELKIRVAPDVNVRVLRRGPTTTPHPIFLLIHGLASNARMWDGVGDALASQGFASVAVDLRGHGHSDKPDTGYDFDTICHDLCALLDELHIERAIFVGQSWGGNIVVHAAHQHPDRVLACVPVDGGVIEIGQLFSKWEDCAERMKPPRLAGMRSGRLESAIRSTNTDWPESGIIGSLSNFAFHDDGTISPWLTFERHMMILKELWLHQPSQMFPDISRPVLFMPADSGDVNWTSNKEQAINFALEHLPNGRVHWFRPAHHDLHAQFPDRCAEVLVTHIQNGFFS